MGAEAVGSGVDLIERVETPPADIDTQTDVDVDEAIGQLDDDLREFEQLSYEERRQRLLGYRAVFDRQEEPRPTILHAKLNVLEQIRKKKDNQTVSDIARTVPETGIINAVSVAVLDAEHAENYITTINRIWSREGKDAHSLSDLEVFEETENGPRYAIVIAGHQRHAGCGRVIKEYKLDPEDPTQTGIPVSRYINITAREAFKIQFAENHHKKPPPEQESLAIAAFFHEARRDDEAFSYADCARELQVDPKKISESVRFSELPNRILDCVAEGGLSYGIGIELGYLSYRLRRFGYSEKDTNKYLSDGIVVIKENRNWSVKKFNEYVRNRISELAPDTISYDDLVNERNGVRQRNKLIRAEKKRIAERKALITRSLSGLAGALMADLLAWKSGEPCVLDDNKVISAAEAATKLIAESMEVRGLRTGRPDIVRLANILMTMQGPDSEMPEEAIEILDSFGNDEDGSLF